MLPLNKRKLFQILFFTLKNIMSSFKSMLILSSFIPRILSSTFCTQRLTHPVSPLYSHLDYLIPDPDPAVLGRHAVRVDLVHEDIRGAAVVAAVVLPGLCLVAERQAQARRRRGPGEENLLTKGKRTVDVVKSFVVVKISLITKFFTDTCYKCTFDIVRLSILVKLFFSADGQL